MPLDAAFTQAIEDGQSLRTTALQQDGKRPLTSYIRDAFERPKTEILAG